MNKNVTKMIIIPDRGVDLFTLKKQFGVKKGPVKTPITVNMETLGALVNQYNEPKIYEVIILGSETFPEPKVVYSEPVLLTRDNYMQSYYEITGTEQKEVYVKSKPVVEETVEVSPSTESVESIATAEEKVEEAALTERIEEKVEEATPVEEKMGEAALAERIEEKVEEVSEDEAEEDGVDPLLTAGNKKNKGKNKN